MYRDHFPLVSLFVLLAIGSNEGAPSLEAAPSPSIPTARMETWPRVVLTAPGEVELGGAVGAALKRGVERLAQEPFTVDWILADVTFKVDRMIGAAASTGRWVCIF